MLTSAFDGPATSFRLRQAAFWHLTWEQQLAITPDRCAVR